MSASKGPETPQKTTRTRKSKASTTKRSATRRSTLKTTDGKTEAPRKKATRRRSTARKTDTPVAAKTAKTQPVVTRLAVTPEERRCMIAEAAYLKAEVRGFTGHLNERDWFEAEAEIDGLITRLQNQAG